MFRSSYRHRNDEDDGNEPMNKIVSITRHNRGACNGPERTGIPWREFWYEGLSRRMSPCAVTWSRKQSLLFLRVVKAVT